MQSPFTPLLLRSREKETKATVMKYFILFVYWLSNFLGLILDCASFERSRVGVSGLVRTSGQIRTKLLKLDGAQRQFILDDFDF